MITLVYHLNVEEKFQMLIPGLSRTELKTNLGDFWDLPSLKASILNKEAYAFHQVNSGYSGVFYVGTSPLSKTIHFFWSGKDKSVEEPVDYIEIDKFLDYMARLLDCKYICCEGRKGWKPILIPLGYAEDSVIYTKEVSYELPHV